MSDAPAIRIEHILLGAEYTEGTTKKPASLDLAWYDEKQGKNIYKVLTGKRARKLAHLEAGDIYYEEVQAE